MTDTPHPKEQDPSKKGDVHQHVDEGMIIGDYATFNQPINMMFGEKPAPQSTPTTNKPKIRTNIFISYRRKASVWFAVLLRDKLLERIDGEVFLDLNDMRSGAFDVQLSAQLRRSDVVVLLVSEGTFDRIHEPDDWVCKEIEVGMKRALIPLLQNNTLLPKDESLPTSIHGLSRLQAVPVFERYIDAGIDELVRYIQHLREGR